MQQATIAHSGACTGTSPENVPIYSTPTRRALLGLATATALIIAAPVASMPPRHDRWTVLRANWEAASEIANSYYELVYKAEHERINAIIGKQPPLWFEYITKNGQVARYPVDPKSDGSGIYPPTYREIHRNAADAFNAWKDRYARADNDRRWKPVAERMDALWDAECQARKRLFAEPAPYAAALALKVQLALGDDELWDCDREALLADAKRLAA